MLNGQLIVAWEFNLKHIQHLYLFNTLIPNLHDCCLWRPVSIIDMRHITYGVPIYDGNYRWNFLSQSYELTVKVLSFRILTIIACQVN